jgi:hypothetical protein
MIKKKCFKNNWITNKYQEMNIDPILIEKVLYAFELLGNLKRYKSFKRTSSQWK